MFIDHVSLLDYRTYPLLSLPLSSGVTVFLGPNGVGKTNIVEAIDYTANLSSHRVRNDTPLVRVGASRARTGAARLIRTLLLCPGATSNSVTVCCDPRTVRVRI